MPLKRRKCLSHDENFSKLSSEDEQKYEPQFFSHYTMQGCIMECRAKYSLDNCGCLPYYYPEFKNANYKNVGCNATQLKCLANISGVGN